MKLIFYSYLTMVVVAFNIMFFIYTINKAKGSRKVSYYAMTTFAIILWQISEFINSSFMLTDNVRILVLKLSDIFMLFTIMFFLFFVWNLVTKDFSRQKEYLTLLFTTFFSFLILLSGRYFTGIRQHRYTSYTGISGVHAALYIFWSSVLFVMILYALLTARSCFRDMKRTSQCNMILAGAVTGIGFTALTEILLPWFGVDILPLGGLSSLFLIFFIYAGILQFRLFDIKTRFISIRYKLIFAFVICSLISIVPVAYFLFSGFSYEMEQRDNVFARTIMSDSSSRIDHYMAEKTRYLTHLSSHLDYPDPDQTRYFLKTNLLDFKDFNELMIIDETGRILISSNMMDEGMVIRHPSLNSSVVYFTDAYRDLFIAVRLHSGDKYIIGKINFQSFTDLLKDISLPWESSSMFFIDDDLQYYPLTNDRIILDKSTAGWLFYDNCLSGNATAGLIADNDGYLFMPAYVNPGLCIVLEMDSENLTRTRSVFLLPIILFSVLVFIVAVTFGIFFSYSILSPLRSLKRSIDDLKNDTYTRVAVDTNDEFQDVAKAFNDMQKRLKMSKDKINHYCRMLQNDVDDRTKQLDKKMKEAEETKAAIFNMMEDMMETNENLKELDKAKSNFLNIVSHELKTPLTAMTAHLEILNDLNKNAKGQEERSIGAIRRNADQLRQLIENILEISRIESNKFQLNLTKLDVNKFIEDNMANLDVVAAKKNIRLIRKFDKIGMITTDEARLREILNNLLSNAIKFTEKGDITVVMKKLRGKIRISVIDTGIGIPKEKMKQLFTKFYQVDATLSRRYGGTGLGLSITKQLVELMGGKIWVTSVEGKGSEFTFELPIK